MLHLARKAFFPGKPPFPLLHIDTLWKFREMIAFRDATARRLGLELIVHTNAEGVRRGIDPIGSGSALHTAVMKTEALKQALDRTASMRPSAARGATRKRAAPRSASSRCAAPATSGTRSNQRPELWRLYNTRLRRGRDDAGVSAVELDRARRLGIHRRRSDPGRAALFRQASRPVVARGGAWIMVDDDRLPLQPGEEPQRRRVRFRTLGCYPLTGAIEFGGGDARRNPRRIARRPPLRAPGPADRRRRGGGDGAQKARGLFLMPDSGDPPGRCRANGICCAF